MTHNAASRFKTCPCCEAMAWITTWSCEQPQPIDTQKQFFYGSVSFIGQIIRCQRCGFAFIADPETAKADAFYRNADIAPYIAQRPLRRKYFARLKIALEKHGLDCASIRRVMDFGAGDGAWIDQWRGAQRYATESHQALVAMLADAGAIVVGEGDAPEADLDLVSAFDFLEHLEDPRRFLRAAARQLGPQGKLVVGVPDMGKWAARLFGHRYYLVCPMHYSYFTKAALEKLLKWEFPGHTVSVFHSPAMQVSIGGLSRWLGAGRARQRVVPLPLYYRASLVGLVAPPRKHGHDG